MNWLYYIAEANIYLGVFYLAYRLFLTKETFYQLTRAYLLFACVASFTLPVLQIGALKPVDTAVATTVTYTLPDYTTPQQFMPAIAPAEIIVEHHLTIQDYLLYAYFMGAVVVLFMLMVRLFTLFRLMRNAQLICENKHKLVYLRGTQIAFSFFSYLFIGTDAAGADTIIRHELVHIRQRHSVDIIFLELLKVISWFNPFIYLVQTSLKTVHEYIADEQTAAYETDAISYSSFLVNNAYGTGGSSITHSFFNYNLLKKRIIMLNKQRSGNLARLKYLVTVPVCAALLCTSTLAFSKTYGWVDLDPAKAVEIKMLPTAHKVNAVKVPQLSVLNNVVAEKSRSPLTHKDSHGGRVSPGKLTNAMVPVKEMFAKDPGLLFIVAGKKFDIDRAKLNNKTLISMTCDSLTVYEKGNAYAKSKWGNDVGKVVVLHGNASLKSVDWPSSQKKMAEQVPMVGPMDSLTITPDFRNYLANNIKYPQDALSKDMQFKAITTFIVNNNRITKVELSKGEIWGANGVNEKTVEFMKTFQGAITAAIQNYSGPALATGVYTLPISFAIVKDKSAALVGISMITRSGGRLVTMDDVIIRGVKSGNPPPAIEKPDTITKADLSALYQDIAKRVHYTEADRAAEITGRVIAQFFVDDNQNIQWIKIVRSKSAAMSDEVIRVLKTSTYLKPFKGGTWTLPLYFGIYDETTQELKKDLKGDQSTTPQQAHLAVYNPNAVTIPSPAVSTGILNEIVIRTYVK